MKIIRKPKTKTTNIFNICIGECFTFDDSVFMRVGYSALELKCPECDRGLDADDLFCNTGTGYLAVDLVNGELYQFQFEEVTPIEMEVAEV